MGEMLLDIKSLSSLHGAFPRNNHKLGSAPIATIILRPWYKTHPPLSIDSFMVDISAFRTFFLKVFSCHSNYSFRSKFNKETDNIFIDDQEQTTSELD
jgi:hypothetical protein